MEREKSEEKEGTREGGKEAYQCKYILNIVQYISMIHSFRSKARSKISAYKYINNGYEIVRISYVS